MQKAPPGRGGWQIYHLQGSGALGVYLRHFAWRKNVSSRRGSADYSEGDNTMKLLRRNFVHLIIGVAALLAVLNIARAQTFPTRPITLVVPYAAGGATDVGARIVGEHMSGTLGQRVLIENVVGAGGTTGSARVMRAPPDGHTIVMGSLGTHATSVALYPRLAYKPETDFTPIGMIDAFEVFVVGRKGLP